MHCWIQLTIVEFDDPCKRDEKFMDELRSKGYQYNNRNPKQRNLPKTHVEFHLNDHKIFREIGTEKGLKFGDGLSVLARGEKQDPAGCQNEVIRSPKCHPGIAGKVIEYARAAKARYRRQPTKAKKTAAKSTKLVKKAIGKISIAATMVARYEFM